MSEARQCNCQELSSEALAILLDIDADHVKLILGEATEEKKREVCKTWRGYHERGIDMTKGLDEILANLCQQHEGSPPQSIKSPAEKGSGSPEVTTHGFKQRYYYHSPIRTRITERGITAHQIRETEAAHAFGEGYEKGKYVWLSENPLTEDAVRIDISKLRGENLCWTGQTEGHLLHKGDISIESIAREVTPEVTERKARYEFLRLSEAEYGEALKSGRYPEPTRYEKLTAYYAEPHEPGWKGLSLAEMFPTKYKDLLKRGVPDKLSPVEVKTVIEEKRIPYGR